jgi:putative flippase GtrA
MMRQNISREVITFGVIGTIGFLVDGGLLTLLNSFLNLDLLTSRLCSFSGAVTVTWYLNRNYTFPDQTDDHALHEWTRYAALNGLGALLNLAIFFWLIFEFSALTIVPLVPLAIASLVAMAFNFLVSKYIAFRAVRMWREKTR